MSADTTKRPTWPHSDRPVGTTMPGDFIGQVHPECIEAARPVHTRQNAASLRAVAEHRLATAPDVLADARAEGIKEAALLLERGLEDEGGTDDR